MIEIMLIAGGFGVLVLIAMALFGWLALPRIARDEAKPRVRSLVFVFVVGALSAAAGWGSLTESQQRSSVDRLLDEYCRNAGEEILRTVDADGLIVQPPVHDLAGDYHEDDVRADPWLRKPQRPYQYVEVGPYKPAGPVKYYEAGQYSSSPTLHGVRRSRYGLTWRPLLDVLNRYATVHGDETLIYDLQTGEVLARRVMYYTIHRQRRDDKYIVCSQPDLGIDPAYIDQRVRNSYGFVSRVLRPPASQ